MLPGQFPNELQLMIPDLGIAPEGFHDIQIHEPVYTLFPEEDPMDASTAVSKPDFSLLPAPPGFDRFVWPGTTPGPGGTPSTFDLSTDLPGWFPLGLPCTTGDLPSLPVSLIPSNFPEVSVVGGSPASRCCRTHLPGPMVCWTLCLDRVEPGTWD